MQLISYIKYRFYLSLLCIHLLIMSIFIPSHVVKSIMLYARKMDETIGENIDELIDKYKKGNI